MPLSYHQLKNSCRHLYIYSKWLPPSLHLLKTSCRHLFIYSKRLPPSLHILKRSRYDNGGPKKRRQPFPIHEIGRIDGGRGLQTGENMLRIGKNTFYDQKHKILINIPEFKRSRTGIIVEFRGIPSGFSNQAWKITLTLPLYQV